MRKLVTLGAVPMLIAVLSLLLSGTGSTQINVPDAPDLGVVDLPGMDSPPETLTLSGPIRDFMASHPDFEDFLGVDPGIVEPTLGSDRKPAYASSTTTPTTSGEANFDQWYRDAPGVNQSLDYTITFDRIPDSDPPVYRYANNNFFPIDNQLWGNEGQPHNYWFTYELHSSFTYQGGEVFNFTGDDDVWVFINDQLVIDLGGVHGAMSASVSLDDVAADLGLTQGETYNFDMFFAERHTTQSNFVAETSVRFEPLPLPTPTLPPPPTSEPPPPPTSEPPPPCEKKPC